MVLKLSFIMICPSENFASSSSTSHRCYTEEMNVSLEEICVSGFIQVISSRATFLSPEGQADQPANSHRQGEHRDPILLIMGVIFIGWNGELLPHQSQKIVEKMHR